MTLATFPLSTHIFCVWNSCSITWETPPRPRLHPPIWISWVDHPTPPYLTCARGTTGVKYGFNQEYIHMEKQPWVYCQQETGKLADWQKQGQRQGHRASAHETESQPMNGLSSWHMKNPNTTLCMETIINKCGYEFPG